MLYIKLFKLLHHDFVGVIWSDLIESDQTTNYLHLLIQISLKKKTDWCIVVGDINCIHAHFKPVKRAAEKRQRESHVKRLKLRVAHVERHHAEWEADLENVYSGPLKCLQVLSSD